MNSKVLIIDDEPEVIKLIGTILKKEGFETSSAMDPVVAAKRMREDKPHVIILDILMPGGGGQSFLQMMRLVDGFKKTPVIIISGLKKEDAEKKIEGLAVQGILSKPFNADEIVQLVRSLL